MATRANLAEGNAKPPSLRKPADHPSSLVRIPPAYQTNLGAAYAVDSLAALMALPERSINAVITSPPYALHFKKEYGNADKDDYVDWLLPFAKAIKSALTDDGSFILNIGGSYNPGSPTRSLYHFKLLIALVEEVGFHLAQECFWYNPAKLPAPAEWVNVRRERIKDSVEYSRIRASRPFILLLKLKEAPQPSSPILRAAMNAS